MARFSNEEIALAQKVQDTYGVPVSITLAQYGLESGYGNSTVGKNNYFNIKGDGTGGYRDYSSKEESFMDFGKLLSSNRYTEHTSKAQSVQEYIEGVKAGGYAEDPEYVSKVMSIINSNNLTAYDTGDYTLTTSDISLKWWGDIVVVVFCILLVLAGVVFVCLMFGDDIKPKVEQKAVEVLTK